MMSDLFKDINARTKLAGTNKLEILMFSLGVDQRSGRRETYGINVFKVREVMRIPSITKAPDMPASVEGMVSLRGVLVPVIDLAKYTNMVTTAPPSIMIVTEYNGHTQGFLVEAVDTILRLDWASMKVPPDMLNAQLGGLVVAVTELPDKRLVMMMDVEKVLSDTGNFGSDEGLFKQIKPTGLANKTVFFVDDSPVARKQISRTLEAMEVNYISAVNGNKAWEQLKKLADSADVAHIPVSDMFQVILTDVEMPEMDGYMLTRKIKEDQRFANIPVLMHSSLSSLSNQQLGKAVGVDEYVPKFEPQKLSQTLIRLLS
jgi:two-component system chemotaxis response regulator CheV